MRRQFGFTLIELMIVVAIIAIIASIAIPNLLASRLAASESSAIATLRSVTSSQAQFHVRARCDLDGDGTGEYGMFRELSGASPIRTQLSGDATGGVVLNPPVLSGAFRNFGTAGFISRSGYLFAMQLPTAAGDAVDETPGTGTFSGVLGADACETLWCCYAWPATYGSSGTRTFFANQGGDITSTEFSAYSGAARPPASAAFRTASTLTGMTGRVAIGTVGMDGRFWKQVH